MHTNTQIKPIQDLTYGQQKMLRIILKLPQKPFQTSDILSNSHDFDDNLSASAVIGSLANLGYLQKIAGGRDKRWCVAQEVLQQSQQLIIDLKGITSEEMNVSRVETVAETHEDVIDRILNSPRPFKK